MGSLITYFYLPPGPVAEISARRVFRLLVEDYRWVVPKTVGRTVANQRIEDDDTLVERLVQFLVGNGIVSVKGSSSEILLMPDRANVRTATGFLTWHVAPHKATKQWLEDHVRQCAAVAKMLASPLGYACLEDDYRRGRSRIVAADGVNREVPRLAGYANGLLRLYWRNFYGPLFSSLMLKQLRTLPIDVASDLGDGWWLVQPYSSPFDGMTESGRRREAEIVDHLGREFFYDMSAESPPQRFPKIDLE